MRERLDCAVLLTRCTHHWVEPALGSHAGGRLHVHGLDTTVDIAADRAAGALAAESMALRRFDVCVVPVAPSTLSWARMSLAQAMPRMHTPVVAYVKDLTAAGLYDLYELGVADFIRAPFCPHELRIRLERLLDDQRRLPHHATRGSATDGGAGSALYGGLHGCSSGIKTVEESRDYRGFELEAYAIAAASRSATARESFRDAKSHIIARFERAYLKAALGRHGGNIAMAARAAQKHRRAFWALMRKHDIDAAPFRELATSPTPGTSDSHAARSPYGSQRPTVPDAARTAATNAIGVSALDIESVVGRPQYPGLVHCSRTGTVLRSERVSPTSQPGALPGVGG